MLREAMQQLVRFFASSEIGQDFTHAPVLSQVELLSLYASENMPARAGLGIMIIETNPEELNAQWSGLAFGTPPTITCNTPTFSIRYTIDGKQGSAFLSVEEYRDVVAQLREQVSQKGLVYELPHIEKLEKTS